MKAKCPHCGAEHDYADDLVGLEIPCRSCDELFRPAALPSSVRPTEGEGSKGGHRIQVPGRSPLARFLRNRRAVIATAVGSVVVVTAIGYYWHRRGRFGHLETTLEWFAENKVFPAITFEPDKATTGILRGRQFFKVDLYEDVNKPPLATAYFDKVRTVRGVCFSLRPPEGTDHVSSSIRARVRHRSMRVCHEYVYAWTGVYIRAKFKADGSHLVKISKDEVLQGHQTETYYVGSKGCHVEFILLTKPAPQGDGRLVYQAVIVIRDKSW